MVGKDLLKLNVIQPHVSIYFLKLLFPYIDRYMKPETKFLRKTF